MVPIVVVCKAGLWQACRDHVQSLSGPSRGPKSAIRTPCRLAVAAPFITSSGTCSLACNCMGHN